MHLSRRGQRLEAWLVEEESGYNFSATGGVVLFNPCNIFNARSRFLRLPPIRLSLFPSSLRLLVSSSTRLCSREYISMHFPGQLALSLARPFPSSPSYARFNYQLFRVSQEFALAPPPPPRRHCFLSCVFFPLFLSRSSHGPHPPSLWTSVDKVRACVQIYAEEYSRAKEDSSPLYLPFPIARTAPSRFQISIPRRAWSVFPLSPHHDPTTFPRDNRR